MRTDEFMLTAEELRQRRKKRRVMLAGSGALLLFLAVVILGWRPAAGAIRGWQSRRHAARATALMEQQNFNDARLEAVTAYQLRPTEPEGLRAVARYLSRTRQPQALDFWQYLRAVANLTREDLRDEANIALVAGEKDRAASVIAELFTNNAKEIAAIDWLLAAQLSIQKSAPDDAYDDLRKILEDSKATERDKLQAAALEVQAAGSSENERDKQHRVDAWSRIANLARGKDVVALDALLLLARQTLVGGDTSIATADLIGLLENHPLAKAPQKLVALDLRMREQPSKKNEFVNLAMAQWQEGDLPSLIALATWLNGHEEFERTLLAAPLEKALKNRELLLQHLDALGALGHWDEIRKLLEYEKYPLEPVVQQMYLARCYAQMGQKAGAENSWRRALEAAGNDTQKLVTLANYAEKNSALAAAEIAYTSAAFLQPKLRIAQEGRLRTVQAKRDTKAIHDVLVDMLKMWPNDIAIQNDEAYTRLLLLPSDAKKPEVGSQKSETEELIEIEHLAEGLVKSAPTSLPHRTVLALALLKQARPAAALEVYANIRVAPNALVPGALAVHAAVLAANNNIEGAKTEVDRIRIDNLLPEERALISGVTSDQ